MKPMVEEIRRQLMQDSEEKYRDFNASLVPGDNIHMLGIRVPKLRETAKTLAKENGRQYIEEITVYEQRQDIYHEELLLHGMIIGYLKCDMEERMRFLDEFVPQINNWAVCDSSCMTYKFMKKDQELWYHYLEKFFHSDREYEIRFGIVSLLDHFITEEFIDRVLDKLADIRHEGYYVKMAIAWAVSVCYVKFPKQTWELLEGDELDDFTHQKSIQKIRESYRVSKEEKEKVLGLKRSSTACRK